MHIPYSHNLLLSHITLFSCFVKGVNKFFETQHTSEVQVVSGGFGWEIFQTYRCDNTLGNLKVFF